MYLILTPISEWTKSNLDIIFFIYGLAFVTMGIIISVQPKKGSRFRLADTLWLLAGFGLIHGANEFLDMWAIIKGGAFALNIVRAFSLIISFVFLFEFGRRFFYICEEKYAKKFEVLFGRWLTPVMVIIVLIMGFISKDLWYSLGIWSRYLLALPAGLLTACGFILYYKHERKELRQAGVKKYFFWASLSFFIYGVLGGLVVPKSDFFLSGFINTDSFLSVMRIPVQVFRAICAIIIAWAVYGMLRIFNLEILEKLEINRNDLEKKIQARTKELTAMQAQLIQAEKLNAVGQLASGVAHEVRNPLGIILQGVNYLEQRISVKEDDISETMAMLKDSVKRADKIINALLDFSKAAKLDLKPEDVNSILNVSLSLLKAKFKFENINIKMELKKDMPKTFADKNKLEQVFINILLNAIQAMPNGGEIIIRSYDKKLEGTVNNGVGKRKDDYFKIGETAVIVEIEDKGPGITEENLKKIFDPFFTTKGPSGGTGLGLSVTRNIINVHKGLIDIKSRQGAGTTMIVTLKTAGE